MCSLYHHLSMKASNLLIVLSALAAVSFDSGVCFEEKAIGLDGIPVAPYILYNHLEEYCANDECRKRFKDRDPEEIPECKENEVYHVANKTDHARLGCKSGCVCMPGFVKLKKRKRCIPVEESDIECRSHEVLGVGKFDCQPYCDIGQDPQCFLNNFDCSLSYNCFCKPGYIRVDGGRCIREERCATYNLEDAIEEKTFSAKEILPEVPFLEKTKVGDDFGA